MASKGPRGNVLMVSTGKNQKGKPTGFSYITSVNSRNTTEKLELEKFDPRAWDADNNRLGMKVKFKQKKLPKSSK